MFHPSNIENTLYDIMEEYEIGLELYESEVVDKISEYLSTYKDNIQWQLGCSDWPNRLGGTCFISFVDEDILHMIGFDYQY